MDWTISTPTLIAIFRHTENLGNLRNVNFPQKKSNQGSHYILLTTAVQSNWLKDNKIWFYNLDVRKQTAITSNKAFLMHYNCMIIVQIY